MSVKKTAKGTWYTKFYYNDWKGERKQKKKEGFDEYCESENQEWFFGFSC